MAKNSLFKVLFHNRWFNFVLAIGSLALCYGFASWAINNGNLLFYAAAIWCFTWAIHRSILGFRYKKS